MKIYKYFNIGKTAIDFTFKNITLIIIDYVHTIRVFGPTATYKRSFSLTLPLQY